VKCSCYILVELDVEPLLDGEVGVALLASLADPVLELLANFCKTDITNVAAGHFPDLPQNGQGVHHLLMSEGELEDEIQLQDVVLGNVNNLDLGAGDGSKEK
jgi:hypothetical protein